MTVIAAITDGTRITMAADTTSIMGGTIIPGARKIRRLTFNGGEQALIGLAGQFALTSLIARTPHGNGPAPDADLAALDHFADQVALRICELATEAKPPVTDTDGHVDAAMILGLRGHLWAIAQQCAQRIPDEYWAVGSGRDIAFGYLAAAGGPYGARWSQAMLTGAVQTACRYDDGCNLGPDQQPQIEVLG